MSVYIELHLMEINEFLDFDLYLHIEYLIKERLKFSTLNYL